MKLEKIIAQLKEKDYVLLNEQLKAHKAEKYLQMLDFYRTSELPEKELQAQLDIKQAAYYTLKSRLYDKIQEFLYKSTPDNRVELLSNVANIEYLIFRAPREMALGILLKLESELLRNDMPNELAMVYKALKKLHVYSQKYYDYEQLYNKYVAYNLAHDKAEEVLSFFCRTLLMYYASRDEKLLDILVLYKKEMFTICRVHQSHRLTAYKNILNIQFALFSPVKEEMKNDDTIEDMLRETYSILEAHTENLAYIHLISALHFLSFEYYHQLKLHKNAASYYEKIMEEDSILLYNHTCFSIHFLVSRLEWNYQNNSIDSLLREDALTYVPGEENSVEQILHKHYNAALLFYEGKFAEAAQVINALINEVSFKEMLYLEVETKLFSILLLLLAEKLDLAEITLRSISRKIADSDDGNRYENAQQYIRLFKIVLANKASGKLEKLKEAEKILSITNIGPNRVLPFLQLEEPHLLRLSKF